MDDFGTLDTWLWSLTLTCLRMHLNQITSTQWNAKQPQMDAHNNLVLLNWMNSLTLCNDTGICNHLWIQHQLNHENHPAAKLTKSHYPTPQSPGNYPPYNQFWPCWSYSSSGKCLKFSRPDQWLWTRHIFPRSLFLMTSCTSLFLWTATFNSVTPLSAQPTDTYRLSPPLTKTHFQVIKLDLPSVFSESIYLIYICHEQVIDLFYSLVWRVSALSLTPERLVLP